MNQEFKLKCESGGSPWQQIRRLTCNQRAEKDESKAQKLITRVAKYQRRLDSQSQQFGSAKDHLTPASCATLPKFNPSEIKALYLRCTGGEVETTTILTTKISPRGLSPKKVGDDTVKATSDWKILKIMVKLTIQKRQTQMKVIPSAYELIIRALKQPPRDRKRKKNIKHSGNIAFDEIVNIVQKMLHRSLARELCGNTKQIMGTPQSVGCNVDGHHPHDIIDNINRTAKENISLWHAEDSERRQQRLGLMEACSVPMEVTGSSSSAEGP
ncbi:large ribosomal subunit protein uL11-like [Dugong dugon]